MMLTFQPLSEADLDFVTHTERHSDNRRFVGQWNHDQYRKALTDSNYQCFLFVVGGAPVGHCILFDLHNPDNAVLLKRIVIQARGQGHGRAALGEIIRYVFETVKANRLWLDVRSFNTRAETLYRSMGFRYEGTLRKASRVDGNYYDLNVYGMLQEEFSMQQRSAEEAVAGESIGE